MPWVAMNGDETDKSSGARAFKGRVWVITGTSSGLGRSLVNFALARGDYVIATARNADSIHDFTDSPETASRVHIMKLDVTAPSADLREAAGEAVAKWGHVDVLVNNAGAGFLGITEEVGVEGYQRQFAVNFFGPLNVTNAFLPYMRARREGIIVFIGSRSSWRANIAMMGTYAASKAALTAAAEALAVEVAQFNIKVLNILPGGMQTCSWDKMTLLPTAPSAALPATVKQVGIEETQGNENAGSSTDACPITNWNTEESTEGCIQDYAELRNRQIKWMRSVACDGDPDKCAKAIFDVIAGKFDSSIGSINREKDSEEKKWPEPDLLVLGADAEANIRDKCHAVLRNLDEWRDVTRGISLDP